MRDEDYAIQVDPQDFLANVSDKWETSATMLLPASRLVLLRIGIVLAPGAGALGKMELPFKLGLGGRQGSGKTGARVAKQHDDVQSWVETKVRHTERKQRRCYGCGCEHGGFSLAARPGLQPRL